MGQHRIVRTIERAHPDVVAGLGKCGSATVHEAQGRIGFVDAGIRPIQQDRRVAGSAVTVSCHPGDNLMIHAAVELCQPGDVLVVTNTAPSTHGMFGELIATSLMSRGVQVLVSDAGIRDTSELRQLGFSAWSRHVSCQGTVKASPGSVNVPVVLGGIAVEPGDVIVADDDGVVVVKRSQAAAVLEQSRTREAKEAAVRARLAAGELGVDIYGLRPLLETLGVTYED